MNPAAFYWSGIAEDSPLAAAMRAGYAVGQAMAPEYVGRHSLEEVDGTECKRPVVFLDAFRGWVRELAWRDNRTGAYRNEPVGRRRNTRYDCHICGLEGGH